MITLDTSYTTAFGIGTNTFPFTVGNHPDRVLVIGIAEQEVDFIVSVKYNGVALSMIGDGGESFRSASQWIIKMPPVGTHDIEVVASSGGGLWALSCYNVDQTVTIRGTQTAAMLNGSTYSMDITTVAGDLVLAQGTWSNGSGNNPLLPAIPPQTSIGTPYGTTYVAVGTYLAATGTTTTISGTVQYGPAYYGLFLSALIPAAPAAWKGKFNGLATPSPDDFPGLGSVMGIPVANIKTVNGV